VSLDLRGHGDSEWALNGDYSFTTYAADCIAVCDQLGRPPVLVGASLGGVTAILAEGATDRVVSSGLVLVDTRAGADTHEARKGRGDLAACTLYWGFVVLLWPVLYVLVYTS
jgi:pimeloyl-ACP methyl ester carboxylesterase